MATTQTQKTHVACVSAAGRYCDVRHRTLAAAERHSEKLNRQYRRSFSSGGHTMPTSSGYFEPQEMISW